MTNTNQVEALKTGKVTAQQALLFKDHHCASAAKLKEVTSEQVINFKGNECEALMAQHQDLEFCGNANDF